MALNVTLEVDASDLQSRIDKLKRNMSQAQFDQAMYGIFQRTSRHVSKILKEDLPRQYYISTGLIGKAVKAPQVSAVSCIIPVRDKRGNIGSQYSAKGGAHGWNSLKRKYRVKASIVKAGQSTLPPKMSSYGGQPPFRNLGSSLNNLTYTRAGKARGPIMKVSGIAIPQMPMNRSKADVQMDIKNYLAKTIESRIMAMMAGR